MNKIQKNWGEISMELGKHLQECPLSNFLLSKASKVDYFAIRRYRKGGIKSQTQGALMLCKYFKIEMKISKKMQNPGLEKLITEIASVWDGTESHAQLLSKLIRSTKSFRIQERT